MKQRKWKWLACCIALIGMVFMMPKMSVQAEETQAEETQAGETQVDKNTITLKPIAYNIGDETLKLRLSTNATEYTLAYYYGEITLGYTDEEMFGLATKTGNTEVELLVPLDSDWYLCAWFIDKNGNCLSSNKNPDYQESLIVEDFLLNDYNSEIIYENGDTVESYNPNMSIENGVIRYTSIPRYRGEICIKYPNENNRLSESLALYLSGF